MNPDTKHTVKQLLARINRSRKRLYRKELFSRALDIFSIITLIGISLILLESLAGFSEKIRTVLMLGLGTVASAAIIILLTKPTLRLCGFLNQYTDEDISRIIGAKFEKISDRLENALDLAQMLSKSNLSTSSELIEVSLEHFQRTTSSLDFNKAISFSEIKRSLQNIGSISIIFIIVSIFPGSPFADAALRLWNYDTVYEIKAPFIIEVEPGNVEAIKGESVPIRARIIPASTVQTYESFPKELKLSFADKGVTTEQKITVKADSSGLFHYLFASLKNSLTYHLESEGVQSRNYSISIVDRPFIRSMTMMLIPPSYSKLARQQLDENVGDIIALPGTRVIWEIVASKEIRDAFVVFKNGYELKFKKKDDSYWAYYTVSNPTSYYLELEDLGGITSSSPIEYKIDVLTDANPLVQILSPGKNIDVTETMQLPMAFKISDDFGISQLQLAFRLVQSRFTQQEKEYGIILPFDTLNATNDIVDYDWDLSLLGLVPEDVIEYYAQVFDNDSISGPKSAKSQTYLIRLPSLEEVFADADKGHDDAKNTMEQALKDAEELKNDIQEMSNDLKRNQNMDWQKEKKAEEVVKRYEEIQKNIEQVSKQVDDMTQNMQRHNVLSQETLQKYMELQKTMQELNSPEFQQALQRMQQSMQNVNPDQLREAMKQVEFSEEQFRASIERSLNLIKRIQIEQKVDELVKRAQDLQKQQTNIEEQTRQLKDNNSQEAHDLANKQDEIQQQLKEMRKSLDEIRDKMEEFPKEMPLDKLEDAAKSANDKQMDNSMRQSSENLRSMRMEQAMSSQQQASSSMQEMQEQMSELQEQLLNNQMQQTMNDLRKTMQDLLQLSQQQEQLKNQSRNLDPNSQQFRDVAREQQNLQGDLSNIANALGELSQKSFVVSPEMGKQIGKAMAQMQQAMETIEQRNAGATSSSQGEAMASLNKAATLVQGAMQSLQQQGGQGGGSLLQQLRGMAMQQQGINMQTQQMGQQQGMSQQQMQEMGRLARQQDAVRKSLEQLQKESEANPERNRVMGDLNKIADEMKEVVEQLQQNNTNPATLQKQERILSRLLQAQRSMREKDFEQRRRANTGVTPTRRDPVEFTQQSPNSQYRRDLQRALESGYSKDYIELIRKYYEAIAKDN